MKTIRMISAATMGALALWAASPVARAANTATITYYAISETDKDANHLASGTFSNEVQARLGVNGLPVLNTAAYGCTTNCYAAAGAPTDVLADGEITYWSPALSNGGPGSSSDVALTGSGTVSLPFDVPSNFFPPNGTGSSDYNGFMSATITATLDNPSAEQISFSIGADDMAFAFLDGQVVCDLGGVHAESTGTCVTPFTIGAGSHQLEVFFVDINNSQSGLTFDVSTQDVTTAPPSSVPEPAAVALLVAGLGVLAAGRRRLRGRDPMPPEPASGS